MGGGTEADIPAGRHLTGAAAGVPNGRSLPGIRRSEIATLTHTLFGVVPGITSRMLAPMVKGAEPSDDQRLRVVIVVTVHARHNAAYLARLPDKLAPPDRSRHQFTCSPLVNHRESPRRMIHNKYTFCKLL